MVKNYSFQSKYQNNRNTNISMQRRHTADAHKTLDPTCGATARASPRDTGTLWVVRELEGFFGSF